MGLLVDVLFCTTKGQRSGVWGFGVEAVVDVDRLDICHGSTVSMLACRLVQGAVVVLQGFDRSWQGPGS